MSNQSQDKKPENTQPTNQHPKILAQIQAIMRKKNYTSVEDLDYDIGSFYELVVSLGIGMAKAKNQYDIALLKYREAIGRGLDNTQGYTFEEKVSKIMAHNPDTVKMFETACKFEELWHQMESTHIIATRYLDTLERISKRIYWKGQNR